MINQDLTKGPGIFVRSIRKLGIVFFSICIFFLISLKSFFLKASNLKVPNSIEHQILLNKILTSRSPTFLVAEKILRLTSYDILNSHKNPLKHHIFISSVTWFQKSYFFIDFDERLNFYRKSGLKSHHANLLKMHAFTAYSNGNFSLARQYLENAIHINLELANQAEVINLASSLANLCFITDDYNLGIVYNQLVIDKNRFLNRTIEILPNLFLKNDLYLAAGRFKDAEDLLLKRVLLLCYSGNNKTGEALCYYNLGKSYLGQKKFTESKWFFIQSNTLYKKLNNKRGVIKTLLMLSRTKNKINDHHLALNDIFLAKSHIHNQNKIFELDIARELSVTYKFIGNDKKAKFHQDIYIDTQKNAL